MLHVHKRSTLTNVALRHAQTSHGARHVFGLRNCAYKLLNTSWAMLEKLKRQVACEVCSSVDGHPELSCVETL